jgi:hypothetical protein
MAIAACAAMPEPVVAQQAPAASESRISEAVDYHSHNTVQLGVDGMVKLLQKLGNLQGDE